MHKGDVGDPGDALRPASSLSEFKFALRVGMQKRSGAFPAISLNVEKGERSDQELEPYE